MKRLNTEVSHVSFFLCQVNVLEVLYRCAKGNTAPSDALGTVLPKGTPMHGGFMAMLAKKSSELDLDADLRAILAQYNTGLGAEASVHSLQVRHSVTSLLCPPSDIVIVMLVSYS